MIASGIIACPCHLAVTLPLLAGLLAGTALGHFLTHNPGLVYTGEAIYFVGTLTASILALVQSDALDP